MGSSIAVVVPAFGRAAELAAALRSVLAQTRPAERVLVVDDGSTPPLVLPVDLVGHVELLRLSVNAGAAAARQSAIEVLDTTHVAFLDSDDTWHPDKLARQAAMLEQPGVSDNVAIACGWSYTDRAGRIVRTLLPHASASLADFCSGCWFCPGSTVLMSRRALLRAGGFDPRLRRLEDLDLFLRFALAGGRLAVAPFVGATIRKGSNARRLHVDQAAAILRGKFARTLAEHAEPGLRQRLEAWLAVEQAAAAFNEGQRVRGAMHLARSLALRPRLGLHLADWWDEVEATHGPATRAAAPRSD